MSAVQNYNRLAFDEYQIDTPSLSLCVREYGDPDGVPVLLIMGLGCQIAHWPDHLIDSLLRKKLRLICFDNRDIGLSDTLESRFRVDTRLAYLTHKLGFSPAANYTLHDMAADTSHLINALNVGPVHIVGVSMGGMIAQLLAANYAEQVASLSVLMSSTNSPKLPLPELSLMIKFGLAGKPSKGKDDQIQRWMGFWLLVQSPAYPAPKEEINAMVSEAFERGYLPAGTLRQLQAILATGSLESYTRQISIPTQVIHGQQDPLLKPHCGTRIAKLIPDADLHLIPGMGHDLPRQLSPKISDLIHGHIQEAESRRQDA